MKPISVLTILLSLSPMFSLSRAEPKVTETRVLEPSLDFSQHLQGPATWQFGALGSLSLRMEKDSTLFLLDGSRELLRLKAPEYINQAVPSRDGKTLLLKAMISRGQGSDFACLILVESSKGQITASRVLESKQKLFHGNRWWISEVGAVSNNGTRVLAKFGVSDPADHRMNYEWRTVELASGKILGEGLTIENGALAAKKD